MWRNWQTRRLQVPVGLRPCRFDSYHPHSHNLFPDSELHTIGGFCGTCFAFALAIGGADSLGSALFFGGPDYVPIIAGFVFVLAVAGMVACVAWYRRARFRTVSGRVGAVKFNIR